MTAPRICKHCNGTTYCGGSISSSSGKLKTRPACPTCLVNSRLDPAGIYERVVCSVCRGTGLVEVTADDALRSKQASGWLIRGAVALCGAALLLSGATIFLSTRGINTPEAVQKAVREQARRAARESRDTLHESVSVGMARDYVEWLLGQPDGSHQITNDESVLELWDYDCRDGARVQISILDGKVQAIMP
jgi:hypothetical protein